MGVISRSDGLDFKLDSFVFIYIKSILKYGPSDLDAAATDVLTA
jgi:hypothetical protein